MVSPVLKRRNESFVKQYMKKYENKIVCQVINCSAEFSIKTSSISLAVHLAKIHEIHETGIEDNSEETTCPKSPRKYFCDQNKISGLFIDFVASNIESFILPDRKTVREMIKRRFDKKKNELKDILEISISKINLKCDIWTSLSKDPYLAITCHFITNDWKLNEYLLDIIYFPHPHDASFIRNTVLETKDTE
ncbi:zinc finger BED domain-containing 1-like [Brachionus plicatilis]|uniref:Zinc finger BED domain-containing 1-like n=1 Tax=Brachionus plicatilis TaxID=10195 RepID=A0A3M7PPW7_BRAPC|nr:zinc finger BED domain-containing 1-like [Brachionus plicatilis]